MLSRNTPEAAISESRRPRSQELSPPRDDRNVFGLTDCRAHDRGQDGQTGRVIGHFALIALAGEMATQYGITGWERGTALKAAVDLFVKWQESRHRSEVRQIDVAVTRTRSFLIANGGISFEEIGGAPIANRDGYRDAKWFYILGDAWNRIHAGQSPAEQAKHLHAGGWLARGDGKNLSRLRLPEGLTPRRRAWNVRSRASP